MEKRFRNLADWKKQWQRSTDLKALQRSLKHIDQLYDEVRHSLGRVLMSMEMIEIQEVLENRIEELSSQQNARRVAA
jgi:hypothetical protein